MIGGGLGPRWERAEHKVTLLRVRRRRFLLRGRRARRVPSGSISEALGKVTENPGLYRGAVAIAEYLPTMEVLDEAKGVCSSQDLSARQRLGQILGTG